MKDIITGFFMAWGNFSWIPCPCKIWDEKSRKWMLALMQMAGFMTGLIQLGFFLIIKYLSEYHDYTTPIFLAAGILTVMPFLLTGFIHLDGYMDCCDAIMSRRPLEDRKRILKDSRVGAFAVVMSICLFLIYFVSMLEIVMSISNCAKMVSVAMIPVVARFFASNDVLRLKPMETSQYKNVYGDNGNTKYQRVCIGVGLTIVIMYIAISYIVFAETKYVFIGVIATAIGQVCARSIAVKNLGGINGDIAGYSIVWGELVGVTSMAIV